MSEEKRLITGASDSELRAWDISYLQEVIADFLITGRVNRNLFSYSSKGWNSKIKVVSELVSGEASLPAV